MCTRYSNRSFSLDRDVDGSPKSQSMYAGDKSAIDVDAMLRGDRYEGSDGNDE